MHIKLFSIGPISVYSYGLCLAVGMILAVVFAIRRARVRKLDGDHMFNMAFWAILAGVVGSKVFYYLVEIKSIIADPSLLLDVSNGFVIYGGVIFGVATVALYCKKHHLSILAYMDNTIPMVAIAQGIGRIGCFMAGCCYGNPTGSWCGVVFPTGSLAPTGTPLIPTQLFSSAGDFLLAAFLIFYTRKDKFESRERGKAIGYYALFYSIGRFIIEFFRADPRGSFWIFSTSQWISIIILILTIIWFALIQKRTRKREMEEADAKVAAEMAAGKTEENKTEEEATEQLWN